VTFHAITSPCRFFYVARPRGILIWAKPISSLQYTPTRNIIFHDPPISVMHFLVRSPEVGVRLQYLDKIQNFRKLKKAVMLMQSTRHSLSPEDRDRSSAYPRTTIGSSLPVSAVTPSLLPLTYIMAPTIMY
jgi:hypothetical protein